MRALIVKTSALGDIVQTYPVIEYLKSKRNVEKIGWVVEKRASSLVRSHPHVDTVIEVDSRELKSLFPHFALLREWKNQRSSLRKEEWDVVFDLQGNCKSALFTWTARALQKVGYGRETVSEWPACFAVKERFNPPSSLPIRDEYLWIVQQHFKDVEPFLPSSFELQLNEEERVSFFREISRWPKGSPIWFLSLGSNWPNKMCRTETLVELFRLVKEKYSPYFIFVAGSNEELREVATFAGEFRNFSHVLFQPSLPLLQRLMGKANAVVALDSLVLHLASTTPTPTFGFFGPSCAKKYNPSGKSHGFFQGKCPYNQVFERRCPLLRTCPAGSCLKEADVGPFFEAIGAWQESILRQS
jgi:heptosyltransferase I